MIWLRSPSRVSGAYCAAVGKQDAKFLDEHLSSVALDAWLKTLIKPCARGPGVSATGGAGAGEGDREGGCVAVGMAGYECCDGGAGTCVVLIHCLQTMRRGPPVSAIWKSVDYPYI